MLTLLFDELRSLLEGSEMAVGLELVECLFKLCSPLMLGREGARELLLPMLRVAADHAAIGAEEARRLQLQYAYPPAESKDASPHPRRSSLPPTDAPTGDTPPGTRGRPARKPRPITSLDTALT